MSPPPADPENEFDAVYEGDDADEFLVITMTRRQWWHLDDWRAEWPDRYPKRAAERQAALEAIEAAKPLIEPDGRPPNEYGPWQVGNMGTVGRPVTSWVRGLMGGWMPVVTWEDKPG